MNYINALTQDRLKELLHYNPDAGDFTWAVSRGGTNGLGSVAGCIHHGYRVIKVAERTYGFHLNHGAVS